MNRSSFRRAVPFQIGLQDDRPPSNVRLPQLPLQPYEPPVPNLPPPNPNPVRGISGDAESQQVVLPWAAVLGDRHVYTTNKRWRGIDVYLQTAKYPTMNILAGECLRVAVYAITQGTRVRVASGRMTIADVIGTPITGFPDPAPQRHLIHYVGAIAERFEVVFSEEVDKASATTDMGNVIVTVIASDECVDSSDEDDTAGVVGMSIIGTAGTQRYGLETTNNYAATLAFEAQLVAIDAVTSAGSARWLQLFDAYTAAGNAGAALNNTVPQYSFLIGSPSMLEVPAMRSLKPGITLAQVSSTAAIMTYAHDGTSTGFQVWYR